MNHDNTGRKAIMDGSAPPTPLELRRQKIAKKKLEIAQKYEREGKSDGSVFVATGGTTPRMTIDSTTIDDPTFGFKAGVSSFSDGQKAFTNTVFAPTSPDWSNTKYGSHQEFTEASKAVQTENQSDGHALFRVDSSGKGHLGKHDPVVPMDVLKERLESNSMFGINSGAPTKKSSKFSSYEAFNQSVGNARQVASVLPTTATVGDFRGQASMAVDSDQGKVIGVGISTNNARSTFTTNDLRSTKVTLNSPDSQADVQNQITGGKAKDVTWSVAQHFPK